MHTGAFCDQRVAQVKGTHQGDWNDGVVLLAHVALADEVADQASSRDEGYNAKEQSAPCPHDDEGRVGRRGQSAQPFWPEMLIHICILLLIY